MGRLIQNGTGMEKIEMMDLENLWHKISFL